MPLCRPEQVAGSSYLSRAKAFAKFVLEMVWNAMRSMAPWTMLLEQLAVRTAHKINLLSTPAVAP